MTYAQSGSLDRVPKHKLASVCLSGKLAINAGGAPVVSRRVAEQQQKAMAVFKGEADRLLAQLGENISSVSRNEGKELIEKIRQLDTMAKQAAADIGARLIVRLNLRGDVPAAKRRPAVCIHRAGNSRAAGSRTRTTGSNAKKAASGSGGTDPDPEPRRLSNPSIRNTSLIAANNFRKEVAA